MESFKMTILDERQVPVEQLDHRIHSRRVAKPTNDAETVTYIWHSNAGDEPPNYEGIWLFNQKGKREFRKIMDPNIGPILFPLLFPHGTQDFKQGMPLK